jgi:hypothetical protein
MQRYAIIENNKVTNITIASSEVASERGWILAPENAAIGWDYIDNNFINNIEKPNFAEINRQQAIKLLQETDWTELSSVSNSTNDIYLSNVNEFIEYRKIIRSIAVNPSNEEIIFSQKPEEVWSH